MYHGALAPNAKWRPGVIAYQRQGAPTNSQPCPADHTGTEVDGRFRRPNQDWARLMQRAFDIDVLHCPRCGGRMRLLALIQSTETARRILRHLGLRDHPPPIAPAKTPAFDFDDVA